MANVEMQMVGFEFRVVAADERRILLSDENGQLYEIDSRADGTGESFLNYYRMSAEQLELK